MNHYIETMRWQGGQLHLYDYHRRRFNVTIGQEAFPSIFWLSDWIEAAISGQVTSDSDRFKVRLLYDDRGTIIDRSVTLYHSPSITQLRLKPVSDTFAYPVKSANRDDLNQWNNLLDEGQTWLFVQNDYICETPFTNVCFKHGDEWIVPSHYFLNGTMRQSLLDASKVRVAPVTVGDLPTFESVSLINALNPLGRIVLPIRQVLR